MLTPLAWVLTRRCEPAMSSAVAATRVGVSSLWSFTHRPGSVSALGKPSDSAHCPPYLYTANMGSMADLPRVTAATLDVLEALLDHDDGKLYGLKITKMVGRPTGSVFPILARLEQLQWATSYWETTEQSASGPRRRFYRLSPEGMASARSLLAERRPARRGFGWQPAPGIV